MKNVTDKISDFFGSWWKVIGAFVTAIYIAFTMHDDIKDNKASIELIKTELITVEGRGSKQNKRLLEKLKEVERNDETKDKKIEELQKEVAFIKGQLKERL